MLGERDKRPKARRMALNSSEHCGLLSASSPLVSVKNTSRQALNIACPPSIALAHAPRAQLLVAIGHTLNPPHFLLGRHPEAFRRLWHSLLPQDLRGEARVALPPLHMSHVVRFQRPLSAPPLVSINGESLCSYYG